MKQHPYYKHIYVCEDGSIFDNEKNDYLKWSEKPEGYYVISINVTRDGRRTSDRRYVHRLVAEVYVDKPLGKPQVNHIDLDKANNRWTNLEWVTAAENQLHSHMNQYIDFHGEKNPGAKMTEATVRNICEMIQDGHRNVDIANHFGVKTQTVSDIRCRKVWAWVGNDYNMKVSRKNRRSEKTILWVAELLEQGLTPKRIHKKTGVSLGEVYDIKNKRMFSSLTEGFNFD